MPQVSRLVDASLQCLANNVDAIPSLEGLPEELVLVLFDLVLGKGKLTPRVLKLFQETHHAWMLQRIEHLHLRDPPPLIPTTHKPWLGEKC